MSTDHNSRVNPEIIYILPKLFHCNPRPFVLGTQIFILNIIRFLSDSSAEANIKNRVPSIESCYKNCINPAYTCSGDISLIHLKWLLGQVLRPICEQGRHDRSVFSITTDIARYGKNPNSLTVDPKIADTGVLTAVAICIRPLSFETTPSPFETI